MSKLVDDKLFNRPDLQDDFVEEFNELDVVARWTDVSGDTGAAPALAADGTSSVILTTGGTDNNEAYLTSNRTWDLANGQPLTMDFQAKFTEANTDDANVIMGLMSGAGANALLDNGAGPAADYSGFVFFKEDGATVWSVESSVSTAQTTTVTDVTAGSATFQHFRIEVRPVSATEAEVVFLHGDAGGNHFTQCKDANGNAIKHTITYTSFAAAKVVIGGKAGGANSETPAFDRVRVSQVK